MHMLCGFVCGGVHAPICMYLEDVFKAYLLSLTKICLFLAICTPVGWGCALECSCQQRKEGVVGCPGAGVR